MKTKRQATSSGFSIVELLVVLGIVMVIMAMALPNMMNAIADFKLRSNVSNLAGMMQRTRMEAVRTNTTAAIRTQATGTTLQFYGDLTKPANTEGTVDPGEPRFFLPAGISVPSSGEPAGLQAAAGLSGALAALPIRFNARGLPCVITTGCTSIASNSGFIYYFRDTRPLGTNGWAAVTVTSSGRVRTWWWTGTAWK